MASTMVPHSACASCAPKLGSRVRLRTARAKACTTAHRHQLVRVRRNDTQQDGHNLDGRKRNDPRCEIGNNNNKKKKNRGNARTYTEGRERGGGASSCSILQLSYSL